MRSIVTDESGGKIPAAVSFDTSSAAAARVGVAASRHFAVTDISKSSGTFPSRIRRAKRATSRHARPKFVCLRSARFTSRASPARIASADAGLSV